MKFTLKQFNERFPTSDACLVELKALRFDGWKCPDCDSPALYKVTGRSVYASPCGKQVHPLAGTIFHKSSTDLRTWFMTIFLMTTTRSGVSAKTIERTTGVTYKTAWRMMKQIRTLMDQGGDILSGTVEVDETFLGPNRKKDLRLARGKHTSEAEIVFGVVERGGKAIVSHIPNTGAGTLREAVQKNVAPDSTVYSDGWMPYRKLAKLGYTHAFVDHHNHEFMRGEVGTQTIESFWSVFKRGFRGTYIHCGSAYVSSYAGEYAWRYSNRKSEVPMFEILLKNIVTLKVISL